MAETASSSAAGSRKREGTKARKRRLPAARFRDFVLSGFRDPFGENFLIEQQWGYRSFASPPCHAQ
jgi:hypothetical protein